MLIIHQELIIVMTEKQNPTALSFSSATPAKQKWNHGPLPV